MYPVRKDIFERACTVCRLWFFSDSAALYCSRECAFFAKLEISDNCWNWQGVTNGVGYGWFTFGRNEKIYSHRFSYEFHKTAIPDGLFVCHTCDNRICCRPSHLFLGTAHDNTQDMMKKGRHRYQTGKGENAKHAKLTEKQVLEIRKSTEFARILAAKYRVSVSTIHAVRLRQNWKHLL